MPLAKGTRSQDASGARTAAFFTLIVIAAALAYYVVLYFVAR